MLVDTRELSGDALDWVVAMAEEMPIKHDPMGFGGTKNGGFWVWCDSISGPMMKIGSQSKIGYSPSTNWMQGGPLLESHIGAVSGPTSARDYAIACIKGSSVPVRGSSILIAICRAIVSAKLGDEVDAPAELVEKQK